MQPTKQQIARVMDALLTEALTAQEIASIAFPRLGEHAGARNVQTTLVEMRHGRMVDGPDAEGRYALTHDAVLQIRAAERRPLQVMLPSAERLREVLAPHADRLQIAGSIRRCQADVKDIELCALVTPPVIGRDLFGEPIASHRPLPLLVAVRQCAELIVKQGPKYIKFIAATAAAGTISVDLFMTTDPEQWGMLFFIRTGSSDFSKRAVTYWTKVSGGGHCRDLRLCRPDGTQVATPEEEDVFKALGTKFISPERRTPRE